jgi:hypothetical protein
VNGGPPLIALADNREKDRLSSSRKDMRSVKCQRQATSSVSTGGVRGAHDSGIGLRLPVTDCRGAPVAKCGMSVVAHSCPMRGAHPVDPRLPEHFNV